MAFSCAKTEFAAARHDWWQAVHLAVALNVTAVLSFFGHLYLTFGLEAMAREAAWALQIVALGWVVSALASVALNRELPRHFMRRNPPQQFDAMALRRAALHAPINFAVVSFLGWTIVGAIVTAHLLHGQRYGVMPVLIHVAMSNSYAGELAAILAFYGSEALLARRVLPYALGDTRVSDVPGVFAVPVWGRLTVLVLSTAVFPLLYITALDAMGQLGGPVLYYALAFCVLNCIVQGAFIMRSISLPIGQVASRFKRFRDGQPREHETRVLRADALGRFAEMLDDLIDTIEERDFIRATFGRYVSQQVVERILDGEVNLGGRRMEASVLFADIRGFTTMSEELPPEAVVAFLNEYLEDMVQAITVHDGIPDKFIGDGILAVWGVPVPQPDHAAKAVTAALSMLERVDELNRRRAAVGAGPIHIGIAIHSGELIAGNIGSQKKMEFTVIGDTVNTCARIEALNKELHSPLTISAATWLALDPAVKARFRAVQPLQLRGKRESVQLYALGTAPLPQREPAAAAAAT